MKIVFAEMTGFKLHKLTKTFNFGLVNHISGGNGRGKTAIAEAIVWCLKGCDLAGGTKGIFDRLKNKSAKETKVVIGVEIPKDGEIKRYNFCRTRKGKLTKLFLNGHEAKQMDFDELIGSSTDIFLSIFVPGYFGSIAAAEPTRARNMLVTMLPKIDHSRVLENLEFDDRDRLERLEMINPLKALSDLRMEVSDLDDLLKKVQGKIEYLQIESMLDIPIRMIEEDEEELTELKEGLALLMEGGSQPYQHDLTPFQEKKATLKSNFEEKKRESDRLRQLSEPKAGDLCQECGHVLSEAEATDKHQKRYTTLVTLKEDCDDLKQQGHALLDEIMSISHKNSLLIAEFFKEKGKKMQAVQAKIEILQEQQNERYAKLKMVEDLEKQHVIFEETLMEREEKQADKQAVYNFMLQYADMQVAYVNSFLNLAEIQLFKASQATGEITLDFTLLYDKTEYKSLSTSEKIRCSIELAGLLNRVHDIAYPVYIDNAESIESFEEPDAQYFVSKVVPKAPLSAAAVVA